MVQNCIYNRSNCTGAKSRGYTEDYLGVPVVPSCGVTNKYYYEKSVNFRTFKNVDIAGYIHDAEAMIVLSHVKGHGAWDTEAHVKT